jgi:titin
MNVTTRVRRVLAVVALAGSVAGAAGTAQADSTAMSEPVPTGAPSHPTNEESPPGAVVGPTATPVRADEGTAPPSTTKLLTATDLPARTSAANVIVQSDALLVGTPTAPRSPVATPANASVMLTWNAPVSNGGATVDKYAVQRHTSNGWVNVSFPAGRSSTVGSLTNGIIYSFRIRAHNAAGWGPASTIVNAVPRTVPGAPTGLVATPANASVMLTWNAPVSNGGATVDKYAVQRHTSNGWVNVSFPAGRSSTVGSLTNGINYSFRIRAHNAAGWGPASTIVKAVPFTVPGPPTAVTATGGINSIQLKWARPSSNGGSAITTYRVYLSFDGYTFYMQTSTAATSYTLPQLTKGTTYWFRIAALNAAGEGAASAVVSGRVLTDPSPPPSCSPQQFAPGSYWMKIYWQHPLDDGGAPIESYFIQVWRGNSLIHDTSADGSFLARNLPVVPGYTYDVSVRAFNGAWISDPCTGSVYMNP